MNYLKYFGEFINHLIGQIDQMSLDINMVLEKLDKDQMLRCSKFESLMTQKDNYEAHSKRYQNNSDIRNIESNSKNNITEYEHSNSNSTSNSLARSGTKKIGSDTTSNDISPASSSTAVNPGDSIFTNFTPHSNINDTDSNLEQLERGLIISSPVTAESPSTAIWSDVYEELDVARPFKWDTESICLTIVFFILTVCIILLLCFLFYYISK